MPVIAGTDDSKEGIMLKKEIRIGHVYAVKVGETIRPVRIDKRSTVTGGWNGTNLETGRAVTIRTAAKCRYEMWENLLRPGLYGARYEPERQASKSTSGMIEEAGRDLHSSCVVCGRAFSKPRRRAVCNSAAACAARAVS